MALVALLFAGASTVGFWSASLNLVSATNSEHCGLFFNSLLNAEPGEHQPARSSQLNRFKHRGVRARILVVAFALALLLGLHLLRRRFVVAS